MTYDKPLGKILKKIFEGSLGIGYLAFEYKNSEGNLVSSHTSIQLKDDSGNIVPEVQKHGYMVLSPDKNNQLVLSFSKYVAHIEENVLIFADGSALVVYETTEPDIESLYGDE